MILHPERNWRQSNTPFLDAPHRLDGVRALGHLDVLGDFLVDVGGVGSAVHVDQLDVERGGIRAGLGQSTLT